MSIPVASQPGGERAVSAQVSTDSRPDGTPRGGARARLRQLAWASVPIWSLSLFAFVPFLRLAFARRRARDWLVFVGYLAVVIVEVVLASVAGPEDAVAGAAGGLALVLMAVAAVHALVAFRPVAVLAGASPAQRSERALEDARARMRRRHQARDLAMGNPVLAHELRIGRPDLPHEYDDGGLVDINHVPAGVLASSLGLSPEDTAAVVAARTRLGRFSGAEELSAYTSLAPDQVDALRDWLLFG